ncbi:unnamed protein product [Bursaphelenchus xylophilus]|nr:unnamed protein product [Bursaphelenchus xylophilus]CAG9129310.1 unnamed protein product [Bursaphelenchus xylophilus]
MPVFAWLIFATVTLSYGKSVQAWPYRYERDYVHKSQSSPFEEDLCYRGSSQSPIDITTDHVTYTTHDPLNLVNFNSTGPVMLENQGHTLAITGFPKWKSQPYIFDGLENSTSPRYYLDNIHLHWSDRSWTGSEHRINGVHFAAEVHYVFVGEPNVQGSKPKHVMAVLLRESSTSGVLWDLERHYQHVMNKDEELLIHNGTTAMTFLPHKLDHFYRYVGSLTTAPCTEGIIWTVLATPAKILIHQLNGLRKIQIENQLGDNVGNSRGTVALNGRPIYFRI